MADASVIPMQLSAHLSSFSVWVLDFLGSIPTSGHSQTSSAFINGKRGRTMIKLDGWLDQIDVLTSMSMNRVIVAT